MKAFVKACRKYDMKVGFYFSPEDFWFLHQQGHVIRRKGAAYVDISNNPDLLAYNKRQVKELFTQYGPIDVAFLDAFDNTAIRDYIHELQPECIVTRGEMEISVLGQNDQVVEYRPAANPVSSVEATEEGIRFSVVRAQRLYNDNSWPNPVVVKIKGVAFVQ